MRFLVCLALCAVSALAAAEENFEFKLERGPHAVGVRVLQQYDYARVYKPGFNALTGKPVEGERARPVQMLVWYPAQKGGAPVAYGDYVRAGLSEDDFTRTPQQIEQSMTAWLNKNAARVGITVLQQEMRHAMWAVRDAKPAAGKYPLVVYAPSFGARAHENADLCEFLASQGYVVMSSASMGARSRPMTDDLEGIETQAADIAFLIGAAHNLPQADTAHIAVVGFSWGGLSNVYAAAKDDRIDALVSLDGSVRSYPNFVDGGPEAAKYVTPERVAIPLLYVASHPKSIERFNSNKTSTAYSFMNNMKYSDVYLAVMYPMIHMDFASDALRAVPADPTAAYSRQEVLAAHAWTARYVHQFLDAYIKGSAPAMAFMQKSATTNGSPRQMMTIEKRAAKDRPANFENLTRELNANGYGNAVAAYKKMQKTDSKFQLSENSMNEWAYSLFRAGRSKDAIDLFKLGVLIYPEASNLYDSMAEVYEAGGDRQLAIDNYRRSLELDPSNVNAVQHLKKLEAPR